MDPTDADRTLLKKIIIESGFVRVGRDADHGPYRRLLELGWISTRHTGRDETIYRVTRAGITAAGLD